MKRTIRKKLLTLLMAFVIAFTIMPAENALAVKVSASKNEENMPIGLSQGVYYRIRNAKTNQYLTSDASGMLKLVDKQTAVQKDNSHFLILRYGKNKYRIISKSRYYISIYKTKIGSLKKTTFESLTDVAKNSAYLNITRGAINSNASGLYYIDSANSNYTMTLSSPYVVGKYFSNKNHDLNSTWAFEQVADPDKEKILYSTYYNKDNSIQVNKATIATNGIKSWAKFTSKNFNYFNGANLIATLNIKGNTANIIEFDNTTKYTSTYLKNLGDATNITNFGHSEDHKYHLTKNIKLCFDDKSFDYDENFMSQCRLVMLAGCNTASLESSGNICTDFYNKGAHTVIGFTKDTDYESGAKYIMYFYEYAKKDNLATVWDCHYYAITLLTVFPSVINKNLSKGVVPSFTNTKIYGDKNALVNY